MKMGEFVKQSLEHKFKGKTIKNWNGTTTFKVHKIIVEDGGVDPQWEISLHSQLCEEMIAEARAWQQQNNPKGGKLAPKELDEKWRKGWAESYSMTLVDSELPEIVEIPKEEDDDPTCGGMLSRCEQCDEIAWDGRICHACGMKHI